VRTPSLAKYLGSYVQEWRFYAFAEGALYLRDPLPEQEDEYAWPVSASAPAPV
jgi:hypothetical protein